MTIAGNLQPTAHSLSREGMLAITDVLDEVLSHLEAAYARRQLDHSTRQDLVDRVVRIIAGLLRLVNSDDVDVLGRSMGIAGHDCLWALLSNCNFDPPLLQDQVGYYSVDLPLGSPAGMESGDTIFLRPGDFRKLPLLQTFRMPAGVIAGLKVRSCYARRGLEQTQSVWFWPGESTERVVELVNRGSEPIPLVVATTHPSDWPVQVVMIPVVATTAESFPSTITSADPSPPALVMQTRKEVMLETWKSS
jgi:hypothetical protein